jgi:predicted DNA binding CopG/RHH family protein
MEKSKKNTNPLDREERDLKDALDGLDVKNVKKPPVSTQKMFKKAAANYARKDAKMNIRMDPLELEAIKRRAEDEGLKYQPFVRSVLHKYITGRLVEKKVG